ncbi:hypothetical protein BH24ACT23_BH24ACT23_09660 [soil metagenome]
MSDAGWRDPFEDEAARERAARRAEREKRRLEAQTQESIGERVREELNEQKPAPPPPPPPPPEVPQSSEPEPGPPAVDPPAAPEPDLPETPAPEPELPDAAHTDEHETAAAGGGAPPPPRRPASGVVHRHRFGALAGLLALIAVVIAGAAFIANLGGDAPAPANPAKDRKTIEVVVPEGFDRTQVAKVAKKAGLKGDYLKASETSKALDLDKLGAGDANSLEGFLFPATYELFKGASVKVLVRKQLEAFQANAAEVGLEAAAKKQDRSVYDLVIIASMVEREIAVAEERELAASVINNRLEEGTPLGIDSTIRFEDQNYTEPLVQSRLEADTPYNTRINAGLPPGPIGNPGRASLEAAAKPARTDFFFFVIKPGTCNEHAFVETDAEFAQAEAAYQAALQAEGGSPTEC